jgi:nucleoside-diphosphate-sugar epimerase
MRIFLTGGTGYIGSAVLDALVRGGHHVDALVRNGEAAARVERHGAHPAMGDLLRADSWREAAAAAEGIVHAATEYGPRVERVDRAALDVFAALPPREGRLLIYTSGCWHLGSSPVPMDESARLNPLEYSAWRPAHERRVLGMAAAGVRAAIVRPGIVYGGSRGIVGDVLKDIANGLVRIIGAGENHWPAIYDRDLGELYLRLVNTPDASGVYHANDEADETVNAIVDALAGHARIRPSVRHVPLEEARKKMGPYADALAADQMMRSPRARALGWAPTLHSISGNAARLVEEWRRGEAA